MKASQREQDLQDFVFSAIADHKGSALYQYAKIAQQYYECENPTIAKFEKIVYDMKGKAHIDRFTANHRIASSFFEIVVDQEASYLLRNGVIFSKKETKKKLGKKFDQKVSAALESCLVAGVSFGYWNLDHLEVFSLVDHGSEPGFVPFYDEHDGTLKAGIRYWRLDADSPERATLYELEGYSDFERDNGMISRLSDRKPYITHVRESEVGGVEEEIGENYKTFPIVPMRRNKQCRSELSGHRNLVDALDLVSSGMVNNADEGNLLFWVLTNCGGMDDLDDAQFLYHLRTSRVLHADGDDGAKAEAHTVEAPYQPQQATIDMLTKRLYTDFQAFDASAVSAGNQTATAIRACYVPLDLKTDKTEDFVNDFIDGILDLAGIEDDFTFTRNKIINVTEEIQGLVSAGNYLDDEYITKKILAIMGDVDQFDEVQKRKAGDAAARVKQIEQQFGGGEEGNEE